MKQHFELFKHSEKPLWSVKTILNCEVKALCVGAMKTNTFLENSEL
jgi:hypothetical protein